MSYVLSPLSSSVLLLLLFSLVSCVLSPDNGKRWCENNSVACCLYKGEGGRLVVLSLQVLYIFSAVGELGGVLHHHQRESRPPFPPPTNSLCKIFTNLQYSEK